MQALDEEAPLIEESIIRFMHILLQSLMDGKFLLKLILMLLWTLKYEKIM